MSKDKSRTAHSVKIGRTGMVIALPDFLTHLANGKAPYHFSIGQAAGRWSQCSAR
jgi:hypothetical protein